MNLIHQGKIMHFSNQMQHIWFPVWFQGLWYGERVIHWRQAQQKKTKDALQRKAHTYAGRQPWRKKCANTVRRRNSLRFPFEPPATSVASLLTRNLPLPPYRSPDGWHFYSCTETTVSYPWPTYFVNHLCHLSIHVRKKYASCKKNMDAPRTLSAATTLTCGHTHLDKKLWPAVHPESQGLT